MKNNILFLALYLEINKKRFSSVAVKKLLNIISAIITQGYYRIPGTNHTIGAVGIYPLFKENKKSLRIRLITATGICDEIIINTIDNGYKDNIDNVLIGPHDWFRKSYSERMSPAIAPLEKYIVQI